MRCCMVLLLQLLTLHSSSSVARSFSQLRLRNPLLRHTNAASRLLLFMSSTTTNSMVTPSSAYSQLVSKLETLTHLERCQAVLSYDQLVFMPDAAATARGAQLAALAGVLHAQKTDPELKEVLLQAEKEVIMSTSSSSGSSSSSPTEKENDTNDAKRLVELELKAMQENERIPAALAAKSAALGASAYAAWVQAKKEDNFAAFAPILQDCFDTAMAVADAKRGDNTDISLYTQMLDQYEVGMSQQRIDDIFNTIQSALVPLIQKVTQSPHPVPTDALHCSDSGLDVTQQQKVGTEIVQALGFDTTKGRIDVSVHPFTSSMSSSDVRITSRFRSDEWYQGLAAMIHEAGHAMYEQNLGDSPVQLDSALSMGTHESQSLFWERHVGLSKPFWKWALPKWKERFPEHFEEMSVEEVYAAVNHVKHSLIRVEADELTYPLHVILRYQIEKDVIEGKLKVDDIPKRWNEDMKHLLQVDVPSDAEGCMQDVHWASLAFGYFPTYLIGSATAAQLAHYCAKDLDMEKLCEDGNFLPIKAWLTDKVHRHGKRYKSLDDLLEAELGEKLNPKYFIDYLTEKYSEIYKL